MEKKMDAKEIVRKSNFCIITVLKKTIANRIRRQVYTFKIKPLNCIVYIVAANHISMFYFFALAKKLLNRFCYLWWSTFFAVHYTHFPDYYQNQVH